MRKKYIVVLGWCAVVAALVASCATRPERKTKILSLGTNYRSAIADVVPGGLPSPSEELWVISRAARPTSQSHSDTNQPGLWAKMPGEEQQVALPLKHTDVNAAVAGYIATVDVKQTYHNPHQSRIEAVYVFPLPENGAVTDFVMVIGERRIRGIVREREEAQKIYEAAKASGYVASLLTEERPNIFIQSVANIDPGKSIDVNIRYFNTLAFVDGWYEFVFPMVVGPRFNPPGSAGAIHAVPRGQATGQGTKIEYMRPDERSGHEISLAINLDARVAIEEVTCKSHAIQQEILSAEKRRLRLREEDSIPNKDFVVRWRVAGDTANALTWADERGGFFALMLYPPDDLHKLGRQPLELVFVLDCSGSMSGVPITQAKAAVRWALEHLDGDDTFQLITFSAQASHFGPGPVTATPANIRGALRYLSGLNAEGGTMMTAGMRAALEFPHDPRRLRFVCFLTDGFIGNESEILRLVADLRGSSRIFSFGVGSAPNRYLLDGMARLGAGAVAYLGPRDDGAEVMANFLERISHPALTDIRVEWSDGRPAEIFPRRVPDLFVGRSVTVTGRCPGTNDAELVIRARGNQQALRVPIRFSSSGAAEKALPAVWARAHISDLLMTSITTDDSSAAKAIKEVALGYGLMSAYTAFISVDASNGSKGGHGTRQHVAVPMPENVDYNKTVSEK